MTSHVAIVGAGHAGAQAAIQLRQRGFAGAITLIGAEAHPPYERPPLSKEYFSGEKGWERILIRPVEFWAERAITLRLGCRVVAVDAAQRRLALDDGTAMDFDALIWATGGEARLPPIPGIALPGVQALRTRDDADRLIAAAASAATIAIIGGGYIGLEAAAVLRKRGVAVTVIEAEIRLLARVSGEAISAHVLALHQAHGATLLLNQTAVAITGDAHATGVTLASGHHVAADHILVGIGIIPAVQPLIEAGARDAVGGVLVDAQCRTSLPHVFAIGDCAAHASRFAGDTLIRLESVQNAHDMASVTARNIMGEDAVYAATPWFWSNQYDMRLQTVGLSAGHDAAVLRGDPAEGSFSVVYLRDGAFIALDCVNATRDYVQGRALVEDRARIDPTLLADTNLPLKSLRG